LDGRSPSYLKSENSEETSIGDEMRDPIKLRCGNMEMANKYWLKEEQWISLFCREVV